MSPQVPSWATSYLYLEQIQINAPSYPTQEKEKTAERLPSSDEIFSAFLSSHPEFEAASPEEATTIRIRIAMVKDGSYQSIWQQKVNMVVVTIYSRSAANSGWETHDLTMLEDGTSLRTWEKNEIFYIQRSYAPDETPIFQSSYRDYYCRPVSL